MPKTVKGNLADMVFNHTVEKIVSGQFHSSMRLTERDVAGTLKISRIPVREAFQRLVHDSWLEKSNNGGLYVRRFTEKDIREIFQIREGIEGIAAREAAKCISDEQVAELANIVEILNRYDQDGGGELDEKSKKEYRDTDMSFHRLVVAASGNRRLQKIFLTVVMQSQCFFFVKNAARMLDINTSDEFSLVAHKEIFEAIAAGKAEEAELLLREHLRAGCHVIIKVKQMLGIH